MRSGSVRLEEDRSVLRGGQRDSGGLPAASRADRVWLARGASDRASACSTDNQLPSSRAATRWACVLWYRGMTAEDNAREEDTLPAGTCRSLPRSDPCIQVNGACVPGLRTAGWKSIAVASDSVYATSLSVVRGMMSPLLGLVFCAATRCAAIIRRVHRIRGFQRARSGVRCEETTSSPRREVRRSFTQPAARAMHKCFEERATRGRTRAARGHRGCETGRKGRRKAIGC
ncbi:uncharacterized protein B0H18DRAFT_1037682 [Fomitopsis serialis]|uniref:uncharacterized protein n=1 Tax=Fomitopsis serialis TaxID=139415 RepID=UPI0020085397|nr:uncharacterized protein B0H18DRAFT_1037682 [Neoantrodia serialis]KAH9916682.1 hypothetical protein B0H18DRAFT_1037682 [Neoantrodia serialis]